MKRQQLAMERAATESKKPMPGDVLHVIGHGPAILLEAVRTVDDFDRLRGFLR